MSATNPQTSAIELAAKFAHQTRHDPYRFALRAFPWGEPGTALAMHQGPRAWQAEEMMAISEHLLGPNRFDPYLSSTASGHGIGKSALISMLSLWAIMTFPESRGIVTANTEGQLRTKTWPELRKWYSLCLLRDWFRVDNTTLRSTDPGLEGTWRLDMSPWSENNTEAFAGLHNEGKRILLLCDEASGIARAVFETAMGAMTDLNTEIIMLLLGNPTRPKGYFFDTHNKLRNRWRTRSIDSRTVEGTNKVLMNQWVEDYGEDSDFVRVRVRGMFPKSATSQLIPSDVIERSSTNETSPLVTDPLVFGIDVARFGDDQSVMYARKGKSAAVYGPWKWRGLNTIALADEIIPKLIEFKPHYVNIDGGGVGGGLIDVLRSKGFNVHEVLFGASARNDQYGNKRAEMWCDMRDWLMAGGCIPWYDKELIDDLTNQEYTVPETGKNQLFLVPKDLMKKDGYPSPDSGDALALTFAQVVSPITKPNVTTVLASETAETEYVRGWR